MERDMKSTKGLLFVVALILLSVGQVRAEFRHDAGGGVWKQGRGFSVLISGIASELPLTFLNSSAFLGTGSIWDSHEIPRKW